MNNFNIKNQGEKMNKLAKKLSTLILSSVVLFSGTHINAEIFENGEYDLGEIEKVVIKNHSAKKFKDYFYIGRFHCIVDIYSYSENFYGAKISDTITGFDFRRNWKEQGVQISPELILTNILKAISEYYPKLKLATSTKTKPLSKGNKHKEETKSKKDFCQYDTNYDHNYTNQTFKECLKPKRQDTVTKCKWRAYCKECEDIKSFFMAKKTGEKYVLNCCGCWPFSNSIEKGSRLEFANQKAFNEAINKKTVKYYCTECKKEMEPSDVLFVPTGRKKQSVKCRIRQNKAERDCYDKQKAKK